MSSPSSDSSSTPPVDPELFFRRLMEELPSYVYFKDRDGHFLSVSRKLAEHFGLSDPSEALGKTDADFFPPELAALKRRDEQAIIETGVGFIDKVEEARRGQAGAWVMTSKLPFLSADGKIIGTFGISRDITARRKAEMEAARAKKEIEAKSQQMAAELAVARELQTSLMQSSLQAVQASLGGPPLPSIELRHHYVPCAFLAGDFIHAIPYSPHSFGLLLCDVMGHGVKAALVTTLIRGLLADVHDESHSAAQVLERLNERLCPLLDQPVLPRFVTAVFVRVDLEKRRVEAASAGHFWPLWQGRNGEIEPLSRAQCGAALGFLPGSTYENAVRQLAPGDRLLAYTDGWVEEVNSRGEEFGLRALVHAFAHTRAQPVNAVLPALAAAITRHAEKAEHNDDLCAVLLEFNAETP